jgi:putative Holliday junction resolvase
VGDWVRGVRLGIDVGTVRVGVAACDPDGILASPVATLSRELVEEGDDRVPSDVAELHRLVIERDAIEVVVGLPVTLAGKESHAAAHVRRYAQLLGQVIAPIPVLLADERMSTALAARRLSERGVRGKRQRAVVDQAAAVEILQGWLEASRRKL